MPASTALSAQLLSITVEANTSVLYLETDTVDNVIEEPYLAA